MSAVAACLALATPLLPPAMSRDEADATGGCVQVGAEVAGRFARLLPEGGIDRQFSLPRSRFELGLARDGAAGRLVLGGVRSGGEDSYIGVAGESIVPQVQVAEAKYTAARAGLAVSMGLVDDPWVVTGDQSWDLRAVAPGLGESNAWLERSDLGAIVGWTAPQGWATTALSLTSGEGLARRERNSGQDTSALLVVRPLTPLSRGADLLQLHVWARDGSRGLGRAPDHRLGVRVTHRSDWAAGGVELLSATGIQGDAARTPTGRSAYVQVTPPQVPTLAFARWDDVHEQPSVPATHRKTLRLGAGIRLPPHATGVPPMRLLLGFEQLTQDALVTGLAGAASSQDASALWLQLDLRAREMLGATQPVSFP